MEDTGVLAGSPALELTGVLHILGRVQVTRGWWGDWGEDEAHLGEKRSLKVIQANTDSVVL